MLGNRHYVVSPSSCLERGVTYTLRIDFSRYRSDRATPEANILIDSVCLFFIIIIIVHTRGTYIRLRYRYNTIHDKKRMIYGM